MFQYNLHGSEDNGEYQKYYENQKNRESERKNEHGTDSASINKKGYPVIKQENTPVSLQRIPNSRIIQGFDKQTAMVVVNDIKSDTGKGVLYVPVSQIRTSKSVEYGREISGYSDVIISVDGKTIAPYYVEQNGKMIKDACSLKEFMARQRTSDSIDDFLAERLQKIDENRHQENEGGPTYGQRR